MSSLGASANISTSAPAAASNSAFQAAAAPLPAMTAFLPPRSMNTGSLLSAPMRDAAASAGLLE
jgi:hypothetical protein